MLGQSWSLTFPGFFDKSKTAVQYYASTINKDDPTGILSDDEEDRLNRILRKVQISIPSATFEQIWGLSDLYLYFLGEGIAPHQYGKAGPMFSAMAAFAGAPDKMTIAAFLNAQADVALNLYPEDTFGDRLEAGIQAILEAPARMLEMAVGPISEGTKEISKNAAIVVGGVGVIWIGSKIFNMMGSR